MSLIVESDAFMSVKYERHTHNWLSMDNDLAISTIYLLIGSRLTIKLQEDGIEQIIPTSRIDLPLAKLSACVTHCEVVVAYHTSLALSTMMS